MVRLRVVVLNSQIGQRGPTTGYKVRAQVSRDDALRPGLLQRVRAGGQRGAGRVDVVDEDRRPRRRSAGREAEPRGGAARRAVGAELARGRGAAAQRRASGSPVRRASARARSSAGSKPRARRRAGCAGTATSATSSAAGGAARAARATQDGSPARATARPPVPDARRARRVRPPPPAARRA